MAKFFKHGMHIAHQQSDILDAGAFEIKAPSPWGQGHTTVGTLLLSMRSVFMNRVHRGNLVTVND